MSVTPKTTNCESPLLEDAFGIKTRAATDAWGKKPRSYKGLPIRFRRDAFTYRQIVREGDAAIYEQTRNGCSDPSVRYEVIRIRRRDGFQVNGRLVEAAEIYPKAEAWGMDGFTLTNKDAAFVKLRGIAGPKHSAAGATTREAGTRQRKSHESALERPL